MSPLHVAVIVCFDVLHLLTECSSKENACAGVSTYQFNLQSMGQPDKCRSSHWMSSVKKNSQENTCVGAWNYKEYLFNKVAANQACNYTKIRVQRRCFPVKFVKF